MCGFFLRVFDPRLVDSHGTRGYGGPTILSRLTLTGHLDASLFHVLQREEKGMLDENEEEDHEAKGEAFQEHHLH